MNLLKTDSCSQGGPCRTEPETVEPVERTEPETPTGPNGDDPTGPTSEDLTGPVQEPVDDCDPVFKNIPGGAIDVGAGGGAVWVVNEDDDIFRLNGDGTSWTNIPGKLVKIDVGPDGSAWGVAGNKNIYHYNG